MLKTTRREAMALGAGGILTGLLLKGNPAAAAVADTLTIAYNVNLPSFDPTTGLSSVNPISWVKSA